MQVLRELPPHLRWRICQYLSQPYLPLVPAPPTLWCAQCGECIGVGTNPLVAFLCSVHCRQCTDRQTRCMACWQRDPCTHTLERGGVYYSCQCWEDTYCSCGAAPFPLA